MRRRPRAFQGIRFEQPSHAPYGVGDADDGAVDACPVPPGGKRRIALCQKAAKPSKAISNATDVCNALRSMGSADRESLYALHLDKRNRIIGTEEVAKGTIDGVVTSPRELFKAAILNNAAGMIIAHNHPSGESDPSADDISLTKRVIEAGRLLAIPVLDHVIVGGRSCRSLRESGDVAFAGAEAPRRRRRR